MRTQTDGIGQETLLNSIEIALGTFHPDLRTKMVLLGNTLTCLIIKSGAHQHEWLSVYEVFSRLSTRLNSHMLRESTFFLPTLETLSLERRTEPPPDDAVLMGKQMEEEHREILNQCNVLCGTMNLCYDGQAYLDLMEEARLELVELEAAIKDYESFKTQLMTRLSRISIPRGPKDESQH